MTQDDTPEAVEAMADQLEPIGDGDVCQHCQEYRFPALPETAAMLRRLHQRAVDAERERDQWIANSRENKLIAESNLRERDEAFQRGFQAGFHHPADVDRVMAAAISTARADALKEAMGAANNPPDETSHIWQTLELRRVWQLAQKYSANAIEVLANKEPHHD